MACFEDPFPYYFSVCACFILFYFLLAHRVFERFFSGVLSFVIALFVIAVIKANVPTMWSPLKSLGLLQQILQTATLAFFFEAVSESVSAVVFLFASLILASEVWDFLLTQVAILLNNEKDAPEVYFFLFLTLFILVSLYLVAAWYGVGEKLQSLLIGVAMSELAVLAIQVISAEWYSYTHRDGKVQMCCGSLDPTSGVEYEYLIRNGTELYKDKDFYEHYCPWQLNSVDFGMFALLLFTRYILFSLQHNWCCSGGSVQQQRYDKLVEKEEEEEGGDIQTTTKTTKLKSMKIRASKAITAVEVASKE